jgi:hypothetical protein
VYERFLKLTEYVVQHKFDEASQKYLISSYYSRISGSKKGN